MYRFEKCKIDIQNIRGQGYDGASNMSSERTGVQAHIKQQTVGSFYTLRWALS